MDKGAYPTIEVRWFFKGKVPDQIRQWFQQGEIAPAAEDPREDWYLRLSKHPDLSIKLRQGNLEVKQRVAKLGIQKLASGIKGQVERWQKWSFPVNQTKHNSLNAMSNAWIYVKKERLCKQYAVTASGVEAVEITQDIDQGCTLELTELRVDDRPWYSLGFEASGQEDTLSHTLAQVIQHVFADSNSLHLKAKYSDGYPAWLSRLRDRS